MAKQSNGFENIIFSMIEGDFEVLSSEVKITQSAGAETGFSFLSPQTLEQLLWRPTMCRCFTWPPALIPFPPDLLFYFSEPTLTAS